jgi:putative N6-adenine-specific DNA methylase
MIHKYFAVSARGIERVTGIELEQLGAQNVQPVFGGVHFEGDMELLYRASLWLRTASRILMPLREFAAQSPEMLYSQARRVRWEDYLDPTKTLAVQATIEGAAGRANEKEAEAASSRGDRGRDSRGRDAKGNHSRGREARGRDTYRTPARQRGIDNSMYAALKVKDAIVDRLRREQGSRPDVDKEYPDILVHAHFSGGRCILSLDATGSSLHERGYRVRGTAAPLKETLAAAIVDLSGWDCQVPFLDPMCGSGTLVIEAAMKAMKIAPGLPRKSFGFQRWPQFDGKTWQRIVDETKKAKVAPPEGGIFAADIDPEAVAAAEENARRAGVLEAIRFEVRRFEETTSPAPAPGVLVCNPPYGERLGEESALQALYEQMGPILVSQFPGWKACILAGNLALARHITLAAVDKVKLSNGPLDCRLLKFDLLPRESPTSGIACTPPLTEGG